jgi:hypothetical protein
MADAARYIGYQLRDFASNLVAFHMEELPWPPRLTDRP